MTLDSASMYCNSYLHISKYNVVFQHCLPLSLYLCYSHLVSTHFTSRTIYEKLGGAVSEDQRALYVQRVEEIVPNIRYCAYNIGDTSDISQLVKLRTDTPGFDMLASKIDVCVNL